MKTKNRIWICQFMVLGLGLILTISCDKNDTNKEAATVTDRDGNIYHSVVIGTQTWMIENLKATKYKDGSAIAYPGSDFTLWANNTDGAYAWYNNDAAQKDTYGGLYNWYAIITGKLCPSGWHIPSNDDWIILETYLGNNTGGKLKEAGTVHWQSPNEGATNESGFSALPGGDRTYMGSFELIGESSKWWSSTEYSYNIALSRSLQYFNNAFFHGNDLYKGYGMSVRCLKD
jgi:uncharacterized protein (TIGR02145 family)